MHNPSFWAGVISGMIALTVGIITYQCAQP
jgi:hypothetical protein